MNYAPLGNTAHHSKPATSGGFLPAVVCPLRLDAAALGAFIDDLAWLQLQTVHVLLSGVSLGDRTLWNTQINTMLLKYLPFFSLENIDLMHP